MFKFLLAIFISTYSINGISANIGNSLKNPIDSSSENKIEPNEFSDKSIPVDQTEYSDKSKQSQLKDSAENKNTITPLVKKEKPVASIATPIRKFNSHQNGAQKEQKNLVKNLHLPIALGSSLLIGFGIALGVNHFLFEKENGSTGQDQTNKPTFYLYTTGLGCWGDNGIMEFWHNKLRDSILAQIPESFQVVIVHFDPLMDMLRPNTRIENYYPVKQTIEDLAQNDMSHKRVSASYFLPEFFDHNQVEKLHLVIDFAHLYRYTSLGKVTKMNEDEDEEDEITLNAIYFGFVGTNEVLASRVLSLSKLIEIDEAGSVTTYIDKLIENRYPLHSVYPSDFFTELLREVRKDLEENFSHLPLTSVIELINETKSRHLGALMDLAMSQIWANTPQHLIVKSLSDFIVEKNFIRRLGAN